jgi:hypothetical protein
MANRDTQTPAPDGNLTSVNMTRQEDMEAAITQLQAENRRLYEQLQAQAHQMQVQLQAQAQEQAIQHQAPPNSAQNPALPLNQNDFVHPGNRVRHSAPHPPLFEGDTKEYRGWALEMRNKLAVDGLAIGSNREKFAYIYSRLQGQAKQMSVAFAERGGGK